VLITAAVAMAKNAASPIWNDMNLDRRGSWDGADAPDLILTEPTQIHMRQRVPAESQFDYDGYTPLE
jgi:hypothetical protein